MTLNRSMRAIPVAMVAIVVVLSAAPGTASATPSCAAPTISGTARVDNTLTANQAGCDGLGTSYSFQWASCDTNTGSGCTNVGSSSTYTLAETDIGRYIRLRRTASDLLPPSQVTDVFTAKVKGHPPTDAAFTVAPNPGRVGQAISFTGSGSDPDGQDLDYLWDFDSNGTVDKVSQTGTTTHSFGTTGNRTVTLRVRDTDDDVSPPVSHAVGVHGPPTASFVFSPGSPLTGDDITFTSTARDPDGDPLTYAWDIDADGAFDDGASSVVHASFANPGSYIVTLKVTAGGETSTVFRTVDVDRRPTPGTKKPSKKKKLKLLRPFPNVGIGGYITSHGVRLTVFAIKAPRGSKIMVKCRGHGCPRRTSRKRMGRKKVVTLRSFRRRFRAGAVIKVYVWKKNRIGKYTSFKIRRNRRPSRKDRCLDPDKLRPRRCP